MDKRYVDIILLHSWRPQKYELWAVADVVPYPGLKIRVAEFGQPLVRVAELALKLSPDFSVE